MRAALVGTGVVVAIMACGSARAQSARYLVTAAPLNVGVVPRTLCLAVDPGDPKGVWWWEPGRSGCSTRSTGPAVFRGDDASLKPGAQRGTSEVRFRMQLIAGPASTGLDFVDIRLLLRDGRLESLASGARVTLQPRRALDIPLQP